MSDTGGRHRASAEAVRDAFRLEFGDAYQVFVRDLGKEHGSWPLNDMERSYKLMIRHVRLWKVAFHGTSPRWVHGMYLAALAYFYANEVVAGIMRYKPDSIISVHPLMHHIPLWVLKVAEPAAQGAFRHRHHRPQHMPPDMVPPRRDKVLLPFRRDSEEGPASGPRAVTGPCLRIADQALLLPCRARQERAQEGT